MTLRALAIETSCDDTAVAIVEFDEAKQLVDVRTNFLSSQTALHAVWGGVVPNLAAREHGKNLQPLIQAAFAETNLRPEDIDLIAVTAGPGLIPALVIGVQTAKTLAYRWQKPLLGIHHIEGHIYANFIRNASSDVDSPKTTFPLLALIVSGGHTQLVLMRDHFDYEILGETQDDAAGEAFDKVAKMLGLPYPGGPEISRRATQFQTGPTASTLSDAIQSSCVFPRPMIHSGDFNFSFSGIKTAVLYTLQKQSPETRANPHFVHLVCSEFQTAVVEVLVEKTKQAIRKYAPKTVVIAGGVSANTYLREELATMIARDFSDTTFLTPEFTYSLDNAAMIGSAALFRWAGMNALQKEHSQATWKTLEPNAQSTLHGL